MKSTLASLEGSIEKAGGENPEDRATSPNKRFDVPSESTETKEKKEKEK